MIDGGCWLNVALLGSVSSSRHALAALIDSHVHVTAVLGLDPGRGENVADFHDLAPLALRAGLPYLSFVKVTEPQVEQFLRDHRPDLLWVIGISQLVPQRLIDVAGAGAVGFHPTMLPRGRGRAPVAWTILLGERAAVSLFYLTEEADRGDIIAQREVPVMPGDYSQDLIDRTNEVLADVIRELAPSIKSGVLPRFPQDERRATYYKKRTAADGLICWTDSAEKIERLIRAASRPYPGAFAYWGAVKVTCWRGHVLSLADTPAPAHSPGEVVAVTENRSIIIATGNGCLEITELDGENVDQLPVGARLTVEPL